MKRLFRWSLVALAILTTTAYADVALTPIEPIETGQIIQIQVDGIDADVLCESKVVHWPREGTTCLPVCPWSEDKPYIVFASDVPGEYLISVFAPSADGSITTAEVVIVVEGDRPDPKPDPEPDPNPIPPPGEITVVVISETGTRTAAEARTLGELRAYWIDTEPDYFHQIVDPDLINGLTNKTPVWFAPYLSAVTTQPVQLPVVVFGSMSERQVFSVIAVEPLPEDGDAAVALIKKHGG